MVRIQTLRKIDLSSNVDVWNVHSDENSHKMWKFRLAYSVLYTEVRSIRGLVSGTFKLGSECEQDVSHYSSIPVFLDTIMAGYQGLGIDSSQDGGQKAGTDSASLAWHLCLATWPHGTN